MSHRSTRLHRGHRHTVFGVIGVIAALCAALLSLAGPARAAPGQLDTDTDIGERVVVTLFHGDGCPHCHRALEFLAELQERYGDLVVDDYEVWNDPANRDLMRSFLAELGEEPRAVPTIVIDERVWVGFSDAVAADIEAVVSALSGGAPAPEPSESSVVVDVPGLGEVDVGDRSMVVATLLIGFVDGVNPCSLWVLSILLALVLHSGSRRRVMLVGSVFLFITSALYGLYMLGAYSALDYAGELGWIRAIVAAIAAGFGVLHIKEFVTHRGVSVTIPDARKPRLYRRMRELARADESIPAVVSGTAVLAVGVSLLETPCTAGLPLLWTDMLATRGIDGAGATVLFLLYLSVFLLDELVLFGAAVVTLRATRLQEQHGRALQLVSGTLMLALAATMLLRPEQLESISGTLAIFGGATAVAAVVLLLESVSKHRAPRRPSPST